MSVPKSVLSLMLAATVMVGFSGCNKGPSAEEAKLQQLEAENQSLKAQLQTLQAQAPSSAPLEQTPAVPQESPQAFKDVDNTVPTAAMINDLALLKVFDGVAPLFKPYEPITRGEYIMWLYRAYNAMHPPEKQIRLSPAFKVPYGDIQATHPAYPYVQAFTNAGFSVGYDNKTFKPDQPLTREEMIAIKHGVDGGELYSTTSLSFSDASQVDKRFLDAIYADHQIFGKDGPRGGNVLRAFGAIKAFKPKQPVLRYEAAATLWQTDHRGNITADTALGRVKKP